MGCRFLGLYIYVCIPHGIKVPWRVYLRSNNPWGVGFLGRTYLCLNTPWGEGALEGIFMFCYPMGCRLLGGYIYVRIPHWVLGFTEV